MLGDLGWRRGSQAKEQSMSNSGGLLFFLPSPTPRLNDLVDIRFDFEGFFFQNNKLFL